MKLVIGLGNPGKEYSNTRHNVGHVFVDELQKLGLPKGTIVKKTDTFMNESGGFVKMAIDKYELDPKDLYIIHDDLDIKLGEYKIQFGKGPKDHNGLNDIYEKLGTREFWHVRIGVDDRPLDDRPLGIEYVLQSFPDEEKVKIDSVIKEACHQLINNLQLTINNEATR